MPVKVKDISCTVTFPASAKEAYKHKYAPETTAQTVVADAVAHYELPNDGTTRFYLYADGSEVDVTRTLESLLPEDDDGKGGGSQGVHKLALGLRTETVSG